MLAQSCHVNKQPVQEPNRTAQPKPENSGAHCEYFHFYPFLTSHPSSSSSFSSLLFSSFSLLVKKKSMEPASLISNLQQVLITKREDGNSISSCSSTVDESAVKDCSRAVVLVTNGDGIESPGLTSLVQALLREPRFHVHVCAPQSSVFVCSPFSPFFFLFFFSVWIFSVSSVWLLRKWGATIENFHFGAVKSRNLGLG